jgi:hypothetical protein
VGDGVGREAASPATSEEASGFGEDTVTVTWDEMIVVKVEGLASSVPGGVPTVEVVNQRSVMVTVVTGVA